MNVQRAVEARRSLLEEGFEVAAILVVGFIVLVGAIAYGLGVRLPPPRKARR